MMLGLRRNEVRIVPYNPCWKDEFSQIQADIMFYTGLSPDQVQHIGSTAIEGIQAKPLIDIMIGVGNIESLPAEWYKQLRQAGFYRLRVERPDEIVLAKFTDETFEVKTHFIHLVNRNSQKWNDLLFFRDYLNGNQIERTRYEQVKLSFGAKQGINEYTNHKEDFVRSILAKRNA